MIKILEETTKYPLQKIGEMAGICWNSPTDNKEKNIKRAKDCIVSGHGRTLEFVDVEIVISGYSARVIREWYTHLGGSPTRLQESTRYCKWNETNIVMPKSVSNAMCKNARTKLSYDKFIDGFLDLIEDLEKDGVPKEDIAMFYPLGMETKVVDKRNLRNLVEMYHQRTCTRAYWEYRNLMKELKTELSKISDEWTWVCDNLFVPKCEVTGYCTEKNSCGRKPKE
ncbi:MAG: FAD-dependent thymidylate synthase [Paludibacteraceae bacterium]|nr:FAD-dependent thymidylate synthase [Paludibacteraceae bacterium]